MKNALVFGAVIILVLAATWTGAAPPAGFTQRGERQYLRDVELGQRLSEEEAAWIARDRRLSGWITAYPGIAERLAEHPYAARLFAGQVFFERWAAGNRERAQGVLNSARRWTQMSAAERQSFYEANPALPRLYENDGGGVHRATPRVGTPRSGSPRESSPRTTAPVGGRPRSGTTGQSSP